MRYNWQHEDWPSFIYNLSDELQNLVYRYGLASSHLNGQFNQIANPIKNDGLIDLMVSEAIKTSAIEGEHFDDADVRSSIRNQLGLPLKPELVKDSRAIDLAKLMIDIRQTFKLPLSEHMLFEWHKLIISDPLSRIPIGQWRTDPIHIVSGAIGNERVHFEAPPPQIVPQEMATFVQWFNATDPNQGSSKMSGPIRAALTHIYFESIHPFADGNGRIGRALSEKALSQDLNTPVLLSLSNTIHAKKKAYYQALSFASTGGINVTAWIEYFVDVIYQSQLDAEQKITHILQKANFFDKYDTTFDDKQRKVMKKMFDAGPAGFKGGISAKKYITITGCSKATATRDLSDLLHKGCIRQLEGKGRSIRYALSLNSL